MQCDDGNTETDFDECQNGICVGITQPTAGPSTSAGFVLVTDVRVIFNQQQIPTSGNMIAMSKATSSVSSLILGVHVMNINISTLGYTKPNDVVIWHDWRIEIELNVFAESHVLSTLQSLLETGMLRQAINLDWIIDIQILQAPFTGNNILCSVRNYRIVNHAPYVCFSNSTQNHFPFRI